MGDNQVSDNASVSC